MVIATHHDSTLHLNSSNHPSIPPEGLELIGDVPVTVPDELADYLRSIGVEVTEVHATEPPTNDKPTKKGK